MFECPYCFAKLTGPLTKDRKLFYLCHKCDRFFDIEFLNHLLLLSPTYIKELSFRMTEGTSKGDSDFMGLRE